MEKTFALSAHPITPSPPSYTGVSGRCFRGGEAWCGGDVSQVIWGMGDVAAF